MGQRVEWLEGESEFASIASDWAQLVAADPAPFMTHGWLTAWWRAFGSGARLRVVTAWEGDRLVAGLPLIASGETLQGLANKESTPFRPLAADRSALAPVLRAAYADEASEVVLPEMNVEGPVVETAVMSARAASRHVVVEPGDRPPFVSLTGSFDEYRRLRKTSLAKLERRRRRMEREHDTRMRIVLPPADLHAQLEQGLALEAKGWKGREGTAVNSRLDTSLFYREAARAAHRCGSLRLSEIIVDDELVAFHLGLLFMGRLHGLKTAYSEQHRHLSPGRVMRLEMIRRGYELGLDAYELGGIEAEWKSGFATGRHQLCKVRAYHSGLKPGLRFAYRAGVRPILRRAYRSRIMPWREERARARRRGERP